MNEKKKSVSYPFIGHPPGYQVSRKLTFFQTSPRVHPDRTQGFLRRGVRAQLQNRAFLVRDQSAKDHFWVRDRGRQVRDRSPPHTPADGHHRCFWLRHRSKRAQCARRHQASTPVRRAACCVDAFLWLSPRAFCVPAGGRICDVSLCASHRCG